MKRRKTDKKASIGLAVAFIIFGATGIATTSMAGEASSSNTAAMAQEEFESDPWEPFNSKMFFFNHDILDQYILKPVAKGWNLVLPDVVQRSLRNVVDKTNVLPRLLNSLVQGKFAGAGREVARFTINSTVGLGGFWISLKMALALTRATKIPVRVYGFMGWGPVLI